MDADDLLELTLEVSTIVNASSDVSLKRLATIISRCTAEMLCMWAEIKPCQVSLLAAALLDFWEQDPLTIGILAVLARVPAFHNAVFKFDTEVLEKLLSRANRSHWAGQENQADFACLSLLSLPLPKHVDLPHLASAFFQTLLESVVACPNLFRLRAVLEVTSSQSASVLDLVTPEVMRQFATTCNGILRDNSDHMRGLLCLCIYAATAKQTLSSLLESLTSCPRSIRSSPVVKEWQDGTRKFFVGKKASKTTSLTVLRLLQFCTKDNAISDRQALDGVDLCTKVIEAIDPTVLSQWAKENASLMEKLQVRLNTGNMAKEVQIAVLNMYVTLMCSDTWPLSVPIPLRAILLDLPTDPWLLTVLSTTKKMVISSVLDSIWRSSESLDGCLVLVDEILHFAIDRCQPGRPLDPQLFIDMNFASIGIGTLRQRITNGVALATRIVEFAIANGTPQWWKFDTIKSGGCRIPSDDCCGSKCCHRKAEELRLRLLSSISLLVIGAALKPSSCPAHCRIPPSLISSLLQQCENPCLTGVAPLCPSDGGLHRRTSSLLARSSVSVSNDYHNRSQTLGIGLQADESASNELITEHVDSICHDFKERCTTVESPLCEAFEAGDAVRKELDLNNGEVMTTSRQKNTSKDDLQRAREAVAAEKEATSILRRCFDAAVERETILRQGLADCERAITNTTAEAAQKLKPTEHFANAAVDAIEAAHLAKLAQLGGAHIAENEKVSKLERENEWMRDHIEVLQKDWQRARIHEVELEQRLKYQTDIISDIQQQETKSKQRLCEKSALLVDAVTDAQSLTVRLASKDKEVAALLDQQQQCEAECQRLLYDLKQANAFKERIFSTINLFSAADGPAINLPVSMTNVPPPHHHKPSMPTLEEECGEN